MLLISHNVFWFQSYPSEPPHQHIVNTEAFEALISIYKSYKADLIFLQEIQSAAVAGQVALALGMKHDYVPGGELSAYGGVVLWQPNLNCWILNQNIGKQFQRVCQIISINNQLTFANVHLPSDAQLSEQEAYVKRKAEIDLLLSSVKNLDMIVGDFNEEPNEPLDLYLTQMGFMDTFRKISGDTLVSTKGGRRGDYFRIRESYLSSIQKFQIKNLKTDALLCSTGKLLSDHFPLILEIKL